MVSLSVTIWMRNLICLSLRLSSSSLSLRKLPVQGHSRQHKSRFQSVREALMGSSGCEGRLERPPSVEEIVITYDWSMQFEHQQDRQEVFHEVLASKQHLDQGDGEVIRCGVEPLDRGHHAAVVHCAQELRLEKHFSPD